MERTHLDLGKPVVAADGKRVGTVDRLVLDANSKELRQFIVRQGTLLTKDRIIDRPVIDRIDPDGTVHLNVSSEMVDQFPEFYEANFIIPQEEDLTWLPHAWVSGQPIEGAILYPAGGSFGQGYDPQAGVIEAAPLDPPVVETESNLSTDTVLIDEGTSVVDRNGDKIGTVDEIVYDEDGNVVGFVVKAGFIFHHDVRIPADWVESVTTDSVQLTMTAEEAEQAGTHE